MVQLLPGASHAFSDQNGGGPAPHHGGSGGSGHHMFHRGSSINEYRGNHLFGSRPHNSHPLDQFRSRPQTLGGGGGASHHGELFDTPFCPKHAPENRESQGWAEKENGTLLPVVCIGLAALAANLKTIIKVNCYYLVIKSSSFFLEICAFQLIFVEQGR